MKYLLALSIIFFSCNSNQKPVVEKQASDTSKSSIVLIGSGVVKPSKQDTLIRQAVWLDDNGLYKLRTYIRTDSNQISANSAYGYYGPFFPYEHDTTGSFNFIKRIKADEYKKAAQHFPRQRAYVDSVKMLNELSVNGKDVGKARITGGRDANGSSNIVEGLYPGGVPNHGPDNITIGAQAKF